MKHIYLPVWSLLALCCGLVTGCADSSPQPDNPALQITRSESTVAAESSDTVPNAFFYFENEKVPLVIDTTREVLITDTPESIEIPADSLYGSFRQGPYTGYVVGRGKSAGYASEEHIFAVEDVLTDGSPFFPEFLAVIKEAVYIKEAKTLAAELGCEVKYQLESDPTFLKMGLLRGSEMKVLEVTHKLFESGLFLSVDPGLVPVAYEEETSPIPAPFALSAQNDQWNLGTPYGVNAIGAWGYTKGSRDVTLAVLDLVFDASAWPELKGHLHPYKYNAFGFEGEHGRQCAYIAAGDGTTTGYWGVAPGVSVMQIGMMAPINTDAKILSEGYANGINNARYNGADVLNCSWYYPKAEYLPTVVTALKNAIAYGRSGKGCVVVFAAGNEGKIEQPGKSLGEALVVGAVNSNGIVSDFSGKGPEVDLVAPGVGVKVPFKEGYILDGGTSYAAPHAAGTAALILSMRPDLTQKEVRQLMMQTATGRSTPADAYGCGTVDAFNALKALNGDGITITLPYEARGGQLTLNQASYYFSVSGAPKGATCTLDIPGATPDEWVGGYRMSGISSPRTITITAYVDYMRRRFTVTTQLKVIPVKPVISSVTKAGHPAGALEPNSFDLFVDCNNWGAEIEWKVIRQNGTQYTIEEPYYAHDVGFIDKPGFYKTIKACDNMQWAECTIEVKVAIPGLGYDCRTIKVYGTGDNARIEEGM